MQQMRQEHTPQENQEQRSILIIPVPDIDTRIIVDNPLDPHVLWNVEQLAIFISYTFSKTKNVRRFS